MSQLDLNQDCVVYGTVVTSSVTKAYPAADDSEPVYSIEIKPSDEELCFKLGLLYEAHLGPGCINGEAIRDDLMAAKTLTFESILKPLCGGASGSGGEYRRGQQVRVSCRLELTTGCDSLGDGYFGYPRLQLRFVDVVDPVDVTIVPAGSLPGTAESLAAYADF